MGNQEKLKILNKGTITDINNHIDEILTNNNIDEIVEFFTKNYYNLTKISLYRIMYHVIFKARENKEYYNNFITMAKAFTNEEIIIAENEILSTGNPYLIYTFAIETEENGFDVERFRKELSNLGDSTYIKLFNNHFPKVYVENRRIKAIRECNEINAKYIQEHKNTEDKSLPQQIINHFENKLEDKKVKEINEKVNNLLKTDDPYEIYSFFLQNNKYLTRMSVLYIIYRLSNLSAYDYLSDICKYLDTMEIGIIEKEIIASNDPVCIYKFAETNKNLVDIYSLYQAILKTNAELYISKFENLFKDYLDNIIKTKTLTENQEPVLEIKK